jgi:hypothetical protein
MLGPGVTQPATPAQRGGEVPAATRRVVQPLLRHEVVDRAIRAEGLAVRHLPSATAPAARSGLDQRPAGAAARTAARADRVAAVTPIPERVGPCRFGRRGLWITAQCPPELDTLMRNAGGTWDPSARLWLLRIHRLGPVLRALRRTTNPLSRQAGLDLEEG